MAAAYAAEEMHALSGADEGSERHDVRACVLLELHLGLGEREGGLSFVQAGNACAACFAVEGVGYGEMCAGYTITWHGFNMRLGRPLCKTGEVFCR